MPVPDTLAAELAPILQAVTLRSPTALALAGSEVEAPDPQAALAQLQQWLYQRCYVRRLADGPPPAIQPQADPAFLQALAAANASHERWDRGWLLAQMLPNGQVVAQRGGLTRVLWPGEFLTHEGPGAAPRVGAALSIFCPREAPSSQTGFYFAYGETTGDQQDYADVLRLYWNISAAGAPTLVAGVTAALNRFRVPFRLKCGIAPDRFERIDAAVLYVSRRFYRVVAELLRDVLDALRPHLAPDTPLFTLRLAPGFALAEDPGTGESFGMHRCRILAEGFVAAHQRGAEDEQAQLEAIAAQFERHRLDIRRPYLGPGAADIYEPLAALFSGREAAQ